MTAVTTISVSAEEKATILAALRHYADTGMADDVMKRPDNVHFLATNNDEVGSLCGDEVDRLMEEIKAA